MVEVLYHTRKLQIVGLICRKTMRTLPTLRLVILVIYTEIYIENQGWRLICQVFIQTNILYKRARVRDSCTNVPARYKSVGLIFPSHLVCIRMVCNLENTGSKYIGVLAIIAIFFINYIITINILKLLELFI